MQKSFCVQNVIFVLPNLHLPQQQNFGLSLENLNHLGCQTKKICILYDKSQKVSSSLFVLPETKLSRVKSDLFVDVVF